MTVAYCHCGDCKRWTGAPSPAFAAFAEGTLTATPPLGAAQRFAAGVERWRCKACGSPLAARFDYLPGQVYVPLGVLDQAADMPPVVHCHADQALPWLHDNDGLPREAASGRETLNAATGA